VLARKNLHITYAELLGRATNFPPGWPTELTTDRGADGPKAIFIFSAVFAEYASPDLGLVRRAVSSAPTNSVLHHQSIPRGSPAIGASSGASASPARANPRPIAVMAASLNRTSRVPGANQCG